MRAREREWVCIFEIFFGLYILYYNGSISCAQTREKISKSSMCIYEYVFFPQPSKPRTGFEWNKTKYVGWFRERIATRKKRGTFLLRLFHSMNVNVSSNFVSTTLWLSMTSGWLKTIPPSISIVIVFSFVFLFGSVVFFLFFFFILLLKWKISKKKWHKDGGNEVKYKPNMPGICIACNNKCKVCVNYLNYFAAVLSGNCHVSEPMWSEASASQPVTGDNKNMVRKKNVKQHRGQE